MTLCISIARLEPATGELDARLIEGGPGLFGFESTRWKLWGSDAVRALGARLLPVLRDGDLLVGHEELIELRAECEALCAAVAVIANGTGYDEAFITLRLGNLIAAVDVAQYEGAGVLVG